MQTVSDNCGCAGCPLREEFPLNKFIAPVKGSSSRVAVGGYPQEEDAKTGKPWSGGDGRWYEVLYRNTGLKKTEVSQLNVLQCVPPEGKKRSDAIAHCMKAHVEPFLQANKFTRVDIFGEVALNALAGKHSIDTWRGSPVPVLALGTDIRSVPTFDPGYLAKDQSMVPVAVEDLRKTLFRESESYNLYPSIDAVRAFNSTVFAFDIETSRQDNSKIFMVGLSDAAGTATVVPWQEPYIGELKRIFWAAEAVIGQNLIQFDLPILAAAGVKIRGPRECMVWDLMLMHHLRFPSFPHRLEFIGKQFTNKGAWKNDKASFETYCARDTDVTFTCFEPLKALLVQADLLDLYKYVSWPLAMICKRMTDRGFKRSMHRVLELRTKYLAEIDAAQASLPEELRTTTEKRNRRIPAPEGTLSEKTGKPIKFLTESYEEEVYPWKSPNVKKQYLYETLGLPKQYHLVSKEVTVDKGALDRLFNKLNNPSKELLKEQGEERLAYLREQVMVLKNINAAATRLSGFAKEAATDDYIHPSFNVHGTEPGRLSSSDPNAQNIPEEARFMYVPRNPDGRIIAMDYSGIENRLTAYLANDHDRLKRLADPEFSEHKYLASNLEGIPYEAVKKSKDRGSWYMIAKAAVHGSDRLMGAKKMWEKNDLPPELVKTALFAWKQLIAGTIRWQKRIVDETGRRGWACNPFGRKLWFWETNSAPRVVSFYPQSTAADVIYRAMIGLMFKLIDWPEEWARKVCPRAEALPEGADLNLQVHDELVAETETAEQVESTVAVMNRVMTQPWPELGTLSLPVGVGVGLSWGECQ